MFSTWHSCQSFPLLCTNFDAYSLDHFYLVNDRIITCYCTPSVSLELNHYLMQGSLTIHGIGLTFFGPRWTKKLSTRHVELVGTIPKWGSSPYCKCLFNTLWKNKAGWPDKKTNFSTGLLRSTLFPYWSKSINLCW